MVGPCGGHARKDGRTGFSSAAPAALQPLRWTHGVQAAGSQICLHNMCGQQRNSPMADPFFGSKYGPQNGVRNWITFSFLLLGLCLGPVLGSRFGPKSGVSHRRILLLPAEVLQADLRRQRLLKAPLKPPSQDVRFPTARSV